jgi:hypothetical protein
MMGINNQANINNKGEITMTAKVLQKRVAKAKLLRVLQTEDGAFYAESAEGKILYRVILDDQETSCTCTDFTRNSKKDQDFQCKHILSVLKCVPTGDVESAQYLERKKPKLDERWVIEIEGNQFVKYAGLLDLGHQKGISQIEVEPLQLPTKENGNFAICKATIISKSGESFSDLGDANFQNCNSKVSKHLLRLASTRAIARSLRTFTNIGITCLEELEDLNDVLGSESNGSNHRGGTTTVGRGGNKTSGRGGKQTTKNKNRVGKQPNAKSTKAVKSNSKGTKKSCPPMSEAQKRAIENLTRRKGVSETETQKTVLDTYDCRLEDMTSENASDLIRRLQQNA